MSYPCFKNVKNVFELPVFNCNIQRKFCAECIPLFVENSIEVMKKCKDYWNETYPEAYLCFKTVKYDQEIHVNYFLLRKLGEL